MRDFVIIFITWAIFMIACVAFAWHFNITGFGSFLSGVIFGLAGAFLGTLIANN